MIKSSKRQISLVAAAIIAAILLIAIAGIALIGTSSANNSAPVLGTVDKEFTIWMRRFEFIPAVITVQQGDYVRLTLKTADVTHGFYIDGYDVNVKVSGSGISESVEFIAAKAGIFKIRCSATCGPFHPFVAGKLVVQQSPNIMPWLIIAGTTAVAALSVGIPAFQLQRRNRRDKSK